MPKMSRALTHWYIPLECLVPTSAFVLAKYRRLIVNRGKVTSKIGISLLEGWIDDIEKSYKLFGIVQSFGNNGKEVHCKTTSAYWNWVRQVLRNRLFSKNKVTAINTVAVIRFQAAVVSWRREDLKETNIGTRKLMAMHGVFHSKPGIATWKESDEAAALYEWPLHGLWHQVRQKLQT